MKQFSLILSVLGTANAYYSQYWTNFDDTVAAIGCEEQVDCGGETCDAGYVCRHTDVGVSVCDDVYRYACRTECPDGQVLSPSQYCQCIDQLERDAMFCQEDYDAFFGLADIIPDIVGGPIEVQCGDGTTVTCASGTLHCFDFDPITCTGHEAIAIEIVPDEGSSTTTTTETTVTETTTTGGSETAITEETTTGGSETTVTEVTTTGGSETTVV